MTTDSLFCAFSTTKAFTAAALSLVIDESKKAAAEGGEGKPIINWDTPIASLLGDDFVLSDNHATLSTSLEDALSHRSGLPGHLGAMMLASPKETLKDVSRKLRHLPLAYAPRTTFNYCNHMYMVISYILERITGEDLGSLLQRRIWKPLNMMDTYFNIHSVRQTPTTNTRVVQGYTYLERQEYYAPEPFANYAPTTGTGAIVSTVLDYAKWLRTLIYKQGPISSEGYSQLLHPRTIISPSIAIQSDLMTPPDCAYHLYALGWFVNNYHGHQFYWHSGSWPGFNIFVGFIPDMQFGLVLMGNSGDARIAELNLYLFLLDKLLGIEREREDYNFANTNNSNITKQDDITPSSGREKGTGKETKPETLKDAINRLYPSLPTPRLNHSVPLSTYAATYKNEGYGSITLTLSPDLGRESDLDIHRQPYPSMANHDQDYIYTRTTTTTNAVDYRLQADLTDRVMESYLILEHASGEYFVAELRIPGRGGTGSEFFRVQFYIDVLGIPRKMGIEFEPSLITREMIWFQRIPG